MPDPRGGVRRARHEVAVVFRTRCGNVGAAVFADAIRLVLAGERTPDALISCAIVSDEEIHALNRRFLRHDYPTDIITFPLEEEPLEAELVISADTARRQAREYGVTMRDECARLAIHGTLHLRGYDDRHESDRVVMKEREEFYLEQFRNFDRTRR
ncbi:MAG: rRNA maturation RNase YbeY [Bacteroidota bacterium]|nr:rRNA maturation RNase YbeY [Bacteroidota bacterium]